MADKTNPNSWIHRLRRRPEPQGTDWGDQGTAFGLEMTLVTPSPAVESGAKSNVATDQTPPRWWSRRR